MSDSEMMVVYRYLPEYKRTPEGMRQGPYVEDAVTAVSFRHAMVVANNLKQKHGKNLISVEVIIRLI